MQRQRSAQSSGGSASRQRRSAPTISSCTSPCAADCHSAPWVVAIAASATRTASPSSSATAIALSTVAVSSVHIAAQR